MGGDLEIDDRLAYEFEWLGTEVGIGGRGGPLEPLPLTARDGGPPLGGGGVAVALGVGS